MDQYTITVILVMITFLIAGTVKGIAGLGLPSVSLALLTVTIDLTSAMVLLVIPSLITNLWQAITGGNFRLILWRIWPFLTVAAMTIWIGVSLISGVNVHWLSALLGLLLMVYALGGLTGFQLVLTANTQRWVGPLFGAINGMVTGLTGSFVVPGVMYLQAMGFSRDELVQAMGMLFFVSTVVLGIALTGNDLFSEQLGLLSLFAVIPVCVGMLLGRKIRHSLSETAFRRVFFILLFALGFYVFAESLLTL
ncbi:MAG: TSUP family transporter [Gammaproteobacteria bacterium]|nr:TSUP family transporter [Gammaproteobacteria bacterium]